MRPKRMFLAGCIVALLTAPALFPAPAAVLEISAATPAQQRYCEPLVFRDQYLIIGYQAVIRAAPGCARPALLRKESRSGSVLDVYQVPTGEVIRVWLFTHRLTYTLDGVTWRRVRAL